MTDPASVQVAPAIDMPWRSVGVWMALLLGLSQLVNAARAIIDPVGFAAYLGLPLLNPADTGFVHVYALRATFLGLFTLLLIARRDLTTLKWFALVAVLMPLGDMLLTATAGAPPATIARHAGYVIYIMVTCGLLHRFTSRSHA